MNKIIYCLFLTSIFFFIRCAPDVAKNKKVKIIEEKDPIVKIVEEKDSMVIIKNNKPE